MTEEAPNELAIFRHHLSEREKELDALYQISELLTRPVISLSEFLRDIAGILRDAMQHPETTCVEIEAEHQHVRVGDAEPSPPANARSATYRVERVYSIEKRVLLTITCYARGGSSQAGNRLDDREQNLVDSTAALIANVLEREDMQNVLRESTRTLQEQASRLEHKNIALREVLSQIEAEKDEIFRTTRAYIETFVQPYLHELRAANALSSEDATRVSLAQEGLRTLLAGGSEQVISSLAMLSPREIEVCGLIRNGLTTKQIASFLHITEKTVERHRNTIRKKLELTGSGINLTTHLRSLR